VFSYPGIIKLAKDSGLPNNPTSTFRPGAVTLRGNVSHHSKGDAVDFWGESQDALAAYFLGFDTLEVFHKSKATGRWYGSSKGKPVDEATHQDLVKEHINHLHVAMSSEQVKEAGVTGSNPLLGALSPGASILGGLPGPFDAAAGIVDVLRPIGVVSFNLANPMFWRRIGMGAVGVSLIAIGIIFINRQRIANVGSAFTGAVGNLAGTAAQGAAFGVGAGATGGIGGKAPASAPPPRGPYPPRRALPPSNAPTTAVLPEAYAPVSAGGTYTVTAVGRAKRPSAPLPDLGGSGKKPKAKKTAERTFAPSVPLRDTK
jgi:hypothetical protein